MRRGLGGMKRLRFSCYRVGFLGRLGRALHPLTPLGGKPAEETRSNLSGWVLMTDASCNGAECVVLQLSPLKDRDQLFFC